MRCFTVIMIFLGILTKGPFVYSQNEIDFIKAYNKHIDQNGKLDSMRMLSIDIHLKASGVVNSTLVKTNRVTNGQFMFDGKEIFIDNKTGEDISEFFSGIFIRHFKNAILARLEFIIIEDPTRFKFLSVTDSITIIQKEIDQEQKFVYTFDTKSKILLLFENIAQKTNLSYHSKTKYLSFQNIDGIIVPKDIVFSTDFAQGTVTYTNVNFYKNGDTP